MENTVNDQTLLSDKTPASLSASEDFTINTRGPDAPEHHLARHHYSTILH